MKKVYFLVLCLMVSVRMFCSELQEKNLKDVKALCEQATEVIGPLALAMQTIKAADQKTTATKLAALTLKTALETAAKNLQDLEKQADKIAFPFTKP